MLVELRFRDFVLIREANLSFDPGFTVLTGETGAGKSLLMQGLHLLLGARGGPHLIRPGAKEAIIEAVISGGGLLTQRLSEMGYEPSEEVVLRRIISPTKSRIYINGSPANLQMLSRLTSGFIILASQHEHQLLARPEDRLRLLDEFAGIKDLLNTYQKAYTRYRHLKTEYENFAQKIGRLEQEKDFLRFQIQEIEEASLTPGEDKTLVEERTRLRNISKLRELIGQVIYNLEKAIEFLSNAKRDIFSASEIDKKLEDSATKIEEFFYEIEDRFFSLQEYLNSLFVDETRLEEIEERLDKINRLKRKYGDSIEEILHKLDELKKEYENLEIGEERLEELGIELKTQEERVHSLAEELSLIRKKAALKLSQQVNAKLSALGMPEAKFEVEVKDTAESFGPFGFDRVEFLVATNPQTELMPLMKIVSGGELSRIFLALKVTLSKDLGTQVLIFDEVDAGIGGLTATKVGAMLKELSRYQQVICVTHLPQIAAMADHHFVVEKESDAKEAYTTIRKLTLEERTKELARMLGQEEAFDLAKRMLEEA